MSIWSQAFPLYFNLWTWAFHYIVSSYESYQSVNGLSKWPLTWFCVYVCLDACVLFGVRGGALGQREQASWSQTTRPTRTPVPPSEGTHGLKPLTDPHTISRQFIHQPSSLTPRWWQRTLSPSSSVRQRELNQLICHPCVFTKDWVSHKPLGTI